MSCNVIFINEPKFSEHEVDFDFNERRKNLIPKLKDLILQHEFFVDKNVEVTFLDTGISSLVSILNTGEKKYIIKIPLSKLTSGLESKFLKAWEGFGVKVPHIFDEGKIGEHFYIIMEYVEAQLLSQKYTPDKLIENKTYKDMGVILRKMHQVKSVGYSNIVNDKIDTEYSNITDWLAGDTRTNEQIAYVREHKILNDIDHGSIEDVLGVIISNVGSEQETVYCHNDFHNGNIFATEPLTVFDPWPCFHHPYMDIGRSVFFAIRAGGYEAGSKFTEGYFDGEEYDHKLLQAFVTLNIWIKIPHMHKRGEIEDIKALQKYLSETKV